MIFHNGYPRCEGVTDFCDSAVLAGILSLFDYPDFKMPIYALENGLPVRCPDSDIPNDECRNWWTFSRDQQLCLVAGYRNKVAVIGTHYGALTRRPANGDWLSPSHYGHISKCLRGVPYTWLQRQWLRADIIFNCLFTPLREPNQLICQMVVAGPEYVQLWKKLNPNWRYAIIKYWNGWRKAPEVSKLMIEKLESF